jgi:hypothetical protein
MSMERKDSTVSRPIPPGLPDPIPSIDAPSVFPKSLESLEATQLPLATWHRIKLPFLTGKEHDKTYWLVPGIDPIVRCPNHLDHSITCPVVQAITALHLHGQLS